MPHPTMTTYDCTEPEDDFDFEDFLRTSDMPPMLDEEERSSDWNHDSPSTELPATSADKLFEAFVKRLMTADQQQPDTAQKKKQRRAKGRATAKGEDADAEAEVKEGEDIEENVPAGSLAEYKPFYEHKDKDGRSEWIVDEPADVVDPVEGKATAKYAFLVRFKKSYDTRKKYDIDSIIVQSPLLKSQLGQALAGYPGITTSLERLVFQAPFRPFVHRWQRLTDLLESTQAKDAVAAEHLKLFLDLLYIELKQAIDAKTDLVKNGVITFNFVWTLFEPETLIYGEQYGQERVWELTSATETQNSNGVRMLSMRAWSVDFDGSNFGRASNHLAIYDFEGTVKITGLSYMPLESHPDRVAIARRIIERGHLFEQFAGYHYKFYTGIALGYGSCGMVKQNISSRIIVDCDAHNRLLPNRSVDVIQLGKEISPFTFWERDNPVQPNDSGPDAATLPKDVSRSRRRWRGRSPSPDPETGDASHADSQRALTIKELLLSTPYVRGFALKTKKWLWLFVNQICEISFNDNAFDLLVLPQHQKRLINAFVKTQARCGSTGRRGKKAEAIFDDVIAGKGLGMIMLLSGPPGVGKTLTAESVSENLRVPLYIMSAGDLGLEPELIEDKLTTVMDMVSKWGAVLLLDEADVFLEARSVSDLERNKLVSIFLRMLEYYEGILFLTTNRIKNIDDAFHSRIHVTVKYPNLSQASRKHIWINFLKPMNSVVTQEEVEELSKLELNGRVIKNVLKTAMMVARSEVDDLEEGTQGSQARLELAHIRTVLAIEQDGD